MSPEERAELDFVRRWNALADLRDAHEKSKWPDRRMRRTRAAAAKARAA